jgi:hypothetical protein
MTKVDNTPKGTSKETNMSNSNSSNDNKCQKPFWKKHFLSLLLLLGIVVAVVWGVIGKNSLEKEYKAKIEQLNSDHSKAMDRIIQEKAEIATSTLALAVRSELIDENNDQVNQYFLQMIKNKEISKIMLINHVNGKILMSTNKKDEGQTFENKNLRNAKNVVSEVKTEMILTATPIMGLNSQMAVIVLETSK